MMIRKSRGKVEVGQSLGHLLKPAGDEGLAQWAVVPAVDGQVAAVGQLHEDEDVLAVAEDVVDEHHEPVLHLYQRGELLREVHLALLRSEVADVDHLQGDLRLAEGVVARLENL